MDMESSGAAMSIEASEAVMGMEASGRCDGHGSQ